MLDLIIRGGKVVDGSGDKTTYIADIGIKDDEIVRIGNLEREIGKNEIIAKGKYVSPGFVDINNHSDTHGTIFKYPFLESMLLQGITTIIGGNCGSSLAPILGEGSIKSLRKWVYLQDLQLDWERMLEYLEYLEYNRPISINYGTLVGHATIRRGILGESIRALKKDELDILSNEVERAIDEGAWGVSTGLEYTHTRISSEEELKLLGEIARKKGVLFSVHLRSEGKNLVSSVKEVIEIAQTTGANIEISHFKALGKKYWNLFSKALELIDKAQQKGLNINFDLYPYAYSGPVIYTLLPEWVTQNNRETLLNLLREPITRKRVIRDMRAENINYSQVVVSSSPLLKLMGSKNVNEIAKLRGVEPEEVIVDLILASEDQGCVILKLMNENNIRKAIRNNNSIISSNGVGCNKDEKDSGNLIHPRSFGTYPKFLSEYVKDEKLVKLEKAVMKITSMPAKKINIRDRGLISEGYKADVVIFDWKKIKDTATIESPYSYCKGIDYVVVNGRIAVSEGEINKEIRAGRILKS